MPCQLTRCILLQATLYAVVTLARGNIILNDKVDEQLIPRVENGTRVIQGQYPWMMALLREEEVFCSATLISTKTALTAAQCFVNIGHVSEIRGRIGDVFWRHGKVVSFSEIKVHEEYNRTLSLYLNDIALLILREAVTISNRVKTLALPPSMIVYDGYIYFAGWGNCVPDIRGQSDKLTLVRWTIVIPEFTEEQRQELNPLGLNSLIWAYSEKGRGPCLGDSGGPWIHRRGLGRIAIAVHSNCFRNYVDPDMHLGISTGYYAEWIRQNAIGEVVFIE